MKTRVKVPVKVLATMLFVLLPGTPLVCAQQPSGVEVVKSSWSKVRIGWERSVWWSTRESS
jgi:hypothetical protein